MSGNDFIILPNGKRIYIKDEYGTVENTEFPKRSRLQSVFWEFDRNGNNKLTSSEIGLIFNSLKECASLDGNNELSDDELLLFIKNNVVDEYILEKLKPNEMLKFLDILQKKSDKTLRKKPSEQIPIGNTIDKLFPELAFLNLGADNDVNVENLTFENIQKHYPDDKYEIQEKTTIMYKCVQSRNSMYYTENKPDESIEYTQVERYEKFIINKETGAVVVQYKRLDNMGDSFNIFDETTNDEIFVSVHDEKNLDIESNSRDSWVQIRNGMMSIVGENGVISYFDEGIIERVEDETSITTYKNGVPHSTEAKEIVETPPPYEPVFNELVNILSVENINIENLNELIENSVQAKGIGEDMDGYFNLTGRELIDDIRNTDLPDDIKQELLNKICSPYVDFKYYDADKEVSSSRIQNKYYTSTDEYSIKFNGPIINIHNKTTGRKSRINLQTLLKDVEYHSRPDLRKSLEAIQSYPGEVLENIAIELESISSLYKKDAYRDDNKMRASGGYVNNNVTLISLGKSKGSILIHELGHAIDDLASGNWASCGKFKEAYDESMRRWEESGHKRFDDQHPWRGNLWGWQIDRRGTTYLTYDEQEAFAICMTLLMGYKDSHTKFAEKITPELIDATRDLYLEIRAKALEERRDF